MGWHFVLVSVCPISSFRLFGMVLRHLAPLSLGAAVTRAVGDLGHHPARRGCVLVCSASCDRPLKVDAPKHHMPISQLFHKIESRTIPGCSDDQKQSEPLPARPAQALDATRVDSHCSGKSVMVREFVLSLAEYTVVDIQREQPSDVSCHFHSSSKGRTKCCIFNDPRTMGHAGVQKK
jgi:hypothetical protein